MSPVLFGDLVALARALMPLGADERPKTAQIIVARAGVAYRWSLRHGNLHPRWGAGTLCDACSGFARANHPRAADPEFRSCLVIACQAVDDAYPDTHETQVDSAGA